MWQFFPFRLDGVKILISVPKRSLIWTLRQKMIPTSTLNRSVFRLKSALFQDAKNIGLQYCPWNGIVVSFSSRRTPNITDDSPFDILGIPKTSTYKEVKSGFIELALASHPDVSKNGDVENFIRYRKAFESLQESQGGGTERRQGEGSSSSGWTDEEFQAWFYEETGHSDILFQIELATRREVIDVANTQSQGGLDRGGMWEMAREMAEQERGLQKRKMDFSPSSIGIESRSSTEESDPSPRRRRSRR